MDFGFSFSVNMVSAGSMRSMRSPKMKVMLNKDSIFESNPRPSHEDDCGVKCWCFGLDNNFLLCTQHRALPGNPMKRTRNERSSDSSCPTLASPAAVT
ncbi:unnamed protein product [Heligmosomoides polygyrus]|uniref:Ovule protein n=1 Tax=Heligmosomoides polygyrus TaxID=6339 RepID=A0A183FD57_HELPZ|nr:unnamed protein product [Heligmosomoides polygyrus]